MAQHKAKKAQLPLVFDACIDYSKERVMIGLSGGINSMAVLCHLAQWPEEKKPKELHLFYAHFAEHSPDTLDFVLAGVEYAKRHFTHVTYQQENNVVLDFFEGKKMIPHPMIAPCTTILKVVPAQAYAFQNGITVDLVGYVRDERRRMVKMAEKTNDDGIDNVITKDGLAKQFPIGNYDDEWCFGIVKQELGWYPAIYDYRWNDKGLLTFMESNLARLDSEGQRSVRKKMGTNERVFGHNNCLPCKNMRLWQLLTVEYFFPAYMEAATGLSNRLQAHWGRDADTYYTTFGRPDYDPSTGVACEKCLF